MRRLLYILSVCLVLVTMMTPMALAHARRVPQEFTILNPRPTRAPITAHALAPRPETLEGKTVAVIANYNETMPALARKLAEVSPNTKVIYISDLPVAAGQTPRPIELEAPIVNMSLADFEKDPKVADAIIVGNGF